MAGAQRPCQYLLLHGKQVYPMKMRYYSCLTVLFISYFCIVGLFPGCATLAVAAGGGVKLDSSLGQTPGVVSGGTVNGKPTTYLITDTLGKKAGSNLFYSFETFNIYTGESATFHSPSNSSYSNIISRVTGGNASSIDGLLRSTIDGANLYLLNPSGVLFGPNASLDVKGSFYVSTADYLKFSNGDVFYADPAKSSVLSVASPEAFGFLTSNPASISVDRSILTVPDGQTLSIAGGNITAQNDPTASTYFDYDNYVPGTTYYTLSAPGGKINLVSVASTGEVNLGNPDISSFTKLGNITFSNGANLNVSSSDLTTPAGEVVIRGGQIFISGSNIDASGNPGGVISVKGNTLLVDGSYLLADTYGDTDHPGAAFDIDLSGDFQMTNASLLDSSSSAAGKAGDMILNARNIKFGDDTPGTGRYADYGFYGAISATSSGTGSGGNISISAGSLVVQNGFYISSSTYGTANAGNVTVRADSIKILDQGSISSNGFGDVGSKGGTVDIKARDIFISATNEASVINSQSTTGIAAQATGSSNGGAIQVSADNIQLFDGGKIDTILWGTGNGANVEVTAKNIQITGFVLDSAATPVPYLLSGIDARVFGADATGTGGNITVTADNLNISNGGVIRTNLYDNTPGKAGNITVNGGVINIASGGQIYADSFRGTGDSGDLNITANSMSITGFGNSHSSYPVPDFTGLSTTKNKGQGGTINVSLTGDLLVTARGGIKADTQGTGLGGAITINAQNVVLTDNSSINSSSSGAGNAGDINITSADSVLLSNSSITTEAMEADGGNIKINTPYMVNLDNSKITASVGGGPQTTGGNISIDPQFVILKNSQIVANAYEGTGGNIQIVADVYLADPQSRVDASSALGISGTVDIEADITNVTGLLTPLSTEFVSASALLRERCIARLRGGKYSSFIVGGRDSLPIEPGNLLPGILQ
ncbi:MAG: filamentous hemagglutinin N-terminal domain-containing protein [Syntrophaceae bacterium]